MRRAARANDVRRVFPGISKKYVPTGYRWAVMRGEILAVDPKDVVGRRSLSILRGSALTNAETRLIKHYEAFKP